MHGETVAGETGAEATCRGAAAEVRASTINLPGESGAGITCCGKATTRSKAGGTDEKAGVDEEPGGGKLGGGLPDDGPED